MSHLDHIFKGMSTYSKKYKKKKKKTPLMSDFN